MKKLLFAAAIALFALVSCNKTEFSPQEDETQVTLNLKVETLDATKSVKAGWEAGDWIYIVLNEKSVKVLYDGHSWAPFDEANQAILNKITAASGSIHAIFIDGNDTYTLGTGSEFFSSDILPSIKGETLTTTGSPTYTLSDGVLSANISLVQAGSQITITNISKEEKWCLGGFFESTSSVYFKNRFYVFEKTCPAMGYNLSDGVAFYGQLNDPELVLINVKTKKAYRLSLPLSIEKGKAYKIAGPELNEFGTITEAHGWVKMNISYSTITYRTVSNTPLTDNGEATLFDDESITNSYDEVTNKGSISFVGAIEELPSKFFYKLDDLSSVELPADIRTIGQAAFSACTNLTEADLGSVSEVGDYAFNGSGLEHLISSNLIKVGKSSFRGSKLQSINCPNLSSFGNFAFSVCEELETVYALGDNTTALSGRLFEECPKLSSFDYLPNLISIGTGCFNACGNFSKFELAPSLTTINSDAFANTDITDLYCRAATPPTIKGTTFKGSTITNILVPAASLSLYQTADGWKDLGATFKALP